MTSPGERLKAARIVAGLSQRKLAHLVGVTSQLISAVEKGDKTLGAENWRRVAEALSVSLDSLIGQTTPVLPRTIETLTVEGRVDSNGFCDTDWSDPDAWVALPAGTDPTACIALRTDPALPEFGGATLVVDLQARNPHPGELIVVEGGVLERWRLGVFEDTVFGTVVRALSAAQEKPQWIVPLGAGWEIAGVVVEAHLVRPRSRR